MFKPEGFSEEIFRLRYAFTEEETWENACKRLARQMAMAETPEKNQKYKDKFYEELVSNRFVPGGRIWYNSGRPNPQLLNCFVLRNDLDSKEGWGSLSKEMIITSMCGGGCVDADTEYFNGQGWTKISEYDGGDVAQYSDNGLLEMVEPNLYIKLPEKQLTHFESKYGVDQVLCDDHMVLYKEGHNGAIKKEKFKYLKERHNKSKKGAYVKFLTTFKNKNKTNSKLSLNELALMVAFIADGTFYNNTKRGKFTLRKKRKIERLKSLFQWSNISFEEKEDKNGDSIFIFDLPKGYGIKYFDKRFYSFSDAELKVIVDEVLHWDGTLGPGNRIGSYCTKLKENADFIQYAFHSQGYRASINFDKREGKGTYRVIPTKRTQPTLSSDVKNKIKMKKFITKDGYKYCFNVPSHNLILRRNNKIFVTGNCGIDFSDVRPRGATIAGHKGDAPGSVELMKLINGNGFPIRAGGARRVALMFSLDLDHPDVELFLDAKLKKGELQNANVSVRSKRTKEFIEAVKNDGDWELSWKGKYKKTISAKRLWNKIVKNAYNSAEPGFLNWELAESESNIHYIENLITSNPCGEICLSSHDCCCLGHLVLPRFVVNGEVDWHMLANTARNGVRFLDNVLTVNHYPLKEMKAKSHKLRRIGMGTTGLADMLALLGYKYGSEEGNKFVDKLYRFISKTSYEASIMIAIEKDPFPAFDVKEHLKSGFIKRLPKKSRALIEEHGIRNCAILTIAPTGTVSILSGNCSGGIEPMFAPAYERNFWDIDERKKELVFHPLFKQFMDEEKDVSHFVASHDLEVRDHMEVQAIIQKHIDNAVSKTINMPKNYLMKDMSELWLEYLPSLKGTTFYREGSRSYIDEETGEEKDPPLVALSIKDAMKKYTKDVKEAVQEDCPTGACEI